MGSQFKLATVFFPINDPETKCICSASIAETESVYSTNEVEVHVCEIYIFCHTSEWLFNSHNSEDCKLFMQ